MMEKDKDWLFTNASHLINAFFLFEHVSHVIFDNREGVDQCPKIV